MIPRSSLTCNLMLIVRDLKISDYLWFCSFLKREFPFSDYFLSSFTVSFEKSNDKHIRTGIVRFLIF